MSACPPYGYDYDSTGGRPLFNEPFRSASTGGTNGQPFPSPMPAFGASVNHPNTHCRLDKVQPNHGRPCFLLPQYLALHRELHVFNGAGTATGNRAGTGLCGHAGHHLLALTPASPGNAARCLSVSEPGQVMPGTNTCGSFNEGGLFTKADGTQVEARGPFGPAFDGITYQKTIGSSSYSALEVTLKHHNHNTELLGAYTYAKSIDNSSSLSEEVNPIDPHISRGDFRLRCAPEFCLELQRCPAFRPIDRRSNRWNRIGRWPASPASAPECR